MSKDLLFLDRAVAVKKVLLTTNNYMATRTEASLTQPDAEELGASRIRIILC